MSEYLDKFRSTMPAMQARHLLKFVNELKDSGTLRNTEEFNLKIQELLSQIEMDAPQFKQFLGYIHELIDSDTYNAMVKAIQADMETAFKETSNATDILNMHKELHKITIIQNLQASIADLDRKISFYEYISRNNRWDAGLTNTFSSLGGTTPRSDPLASTLYKDRRSSIQNIPPEEDANIDLVAEALILPARDSREIDVASVEIIHDGSTTEPPRDLQSPDLHIDNIIDKQNFTYWTYPILLETKQDNVSIKLKLDIGNTQTLNCIAVSPVATIPVLLEKITYIDTENNTVDLEINKMLLKEEKIYFNEITTSSLTFVFKQPNGYPVAYFYQPSTDMWQFANSIDPVDREDPDNDEVGRIAGTLDKIIPMENLKNDCNIPIPPGWQLVKGIQYDFGLDNIRLYSNEYATRGVFVSEILEIDRPGLLGLVVNETKPHIELGDNSYQPYSFEYFVYKLNYDEHHRLIDTESIPLLPMKSRGYITGERLFLSGRSGGGGVNNAAKFMFIPDINIATPVIKKNVLETLTIGTDYLVQVTGAPVRSSWNDVKNDIASTALKFIELTISIVNPSVQSFYTADYVAKTSMNVSPYARLTNNYTIMCDKDRDSDIEIIYSRMYFIAYMRRNYISDNLTSSLEDYKFLVTSYGSDRFGSGD